MGPRKSASDWSNESGYPGALSKLCKEEDVLIIPRFVTHLVGRQVERVSPKKSKDSKLGDRFGSTSVHTNDSRVEDLMICGSLQPPQVAIVYDNPDDKETPVAVICKGIYIEFSLMNAIGKSLKPYPTISCLRIENCCVSLEIVQALALLLAEEDAAKTISDVSLDGNEGLGPALPLFVKLPTGVKYLSLQRCSLDDEAIRDFSEALAFSDVVEHQLQVLNLSMNKIRDEGVFYLADALRTNRTLLSLSLAGNQIGDEGVEHLTQVLQKFPLSYEEVVLRRRRIFEMIFRKKAAVEKYIEERRSKGETESQAAKTSAKSGERTGRKIRGPDGKIRCVSRDKKSKSGPAKVNSGEKFRGKVRGASGEGLGGAEPTAAEVLAFVQQVESEIPPDKHPFVNEVFMSEDALLCKGCWSLGNINLAYNYLSEKSLLNFADAICSQGETFGPKVGLIRLVLLPGNLFEETFPEFQKLQTAMIYRNCKKDPPADNGETVTSARRLSSSGKWTKTDKPRCPF